MYSTAVIWAVCSRPWAGIGCNDAQHVACSLSFVNSSLVSQLAPIAPTLQPTTTICCLCLLAAANLSAKAPTDNCTKIFSPRQGFNNVTVLQPGAGQCGDDGYVDPGTYILSQTPPAGTVFIGWKCYDITTGVIGSNTAVPVTILIGSKSVSCVAEYNYAASPSPSPRYVQALVSALIVYSCAVLPCAMPYVAVLAALSVQGGYAASGCAPLRCAMLSCADMSTVHSTSMPQTCCCWFAAVPHELATQPPAGVRL
jgi:hypothetical protein